MTRRYEVVPRYERVCGIDEVVAWELWCDREQREHYVVGDLIDLFDDESDAIDAMADLNARDAV